MCRFNTKFLAGLWLVLLCAATCCAQIKIEPAYPVYSLISLDVETPPDATYRDIIWQFSPPTISGEQLPDGRFIFTAPPGPYSVRASVVTGTLDGEKITIAKGDHKLYDAKFVIGDAPPPDPDDDDPPPPDPNPLTIEGAFVIVVEESAERTVDAAVLLKDAKYWQTIVDRGMRWRIYDDDQSEVASFLPKVKDILPALIVTDSKGKVLSVDRLPGKKTEVDAIIKKATGK